MKRISPIYAIKISRRAIRSWQKNLERKRTKRCPIKWIEKRVILSENFNFSANYIETVQSLQEFKRATLSKPKSRVRHKVYIDLASVKDISIAGALVLAAEIDRWRRLKRASLKPRDTENWDPIVKRTLTSLGFFDLLGVRIERSANDDFNGKEVVVLPMVTDARLDGEMLYRIGEHLEVVAGVFRQDPTIYAALTEAAYNSTLHAYPTDHNYEFQPLWKRWWATACWSPQESAVRFMIYDQGVGIPATLPRSQKWERIREYISKVPLIGGFSNDASAMIEAAIEVSRTSRDGGHGKGLKDVVAPVTGLEGGRVRILSGRGCYLCYGDGTIEKSDSDLHIGGTLIEWTIPTGHAEVGVES
ncbi:hypothetical protein [Rhodobacter ferrooxidans]|uniref:Uncharacterized protein n=1 Tax=Rhodobacter ferrooxidans TaxID=371731 RepID=C8S4P4_9RHOB|nr:hypothetical protein [Rhodobacter sp. SW2]EEW24043.1 hypothetical protein Rsw2DRAFT_3022 [Rhodobacter sp. SW2]